MHRGRAAFAPKRATSPGSRTTGLNVLRANGTSNVSRELYLNALNPHHALAYRTT